LTVVGWRGARPGARDWRMDALADVGAGGGSIREAAGTGMPEYASCGGRSIVSRRDIV
jgi:hypothetical protein